MHTVNLVFPHQLFEDVPMVGDAPFYLLEEPLFFQQYTFHRQKITYHRATMKGYAAFLEGQGRTVHYVDTHRPEADLRHWVRAMAARGITGIHYIDPTDNWLEKRLLSEAISANVTLVRHENPMFLNTRADNAGFFKPAAKKYFQTKFYIEQRKQRLILLSDDETPVGGKWTFDTENRKRYPAKKMPPPVTRPAMTPHYFEAVEYTRSHFPHNPGVLTDSPLYPLDFGQARLWLRQFLDYRFHEFGTYEDAIVAAEGILHHSVLTPMLNVGLLTPQYILNEALGYAAANDVPLASTEGFVRQIIGWREFIRGVYEAQGTAERRRNFWGFSRKIPPSFYNGSTGIAPIDITIRKVLNTGYCHHIERLMVLGNFMVLCEFHPDEVYRWFMELFIDAYDWVMVPNVYGMSQFADGGLMATKPYISGSNYLLKLGDYPKGEWQVTWDALFWRFLHVNRDFFLKNPRLGMLVHTFDKMPAEKQTQLLDKGDIFLKRLDEGG